MCIYSCVLHHLKLLFCFCFLQGTYQNDDSFTSSEDSLLGRHRNRTTISASSSTSTFIAGSDGSSIVNIHKHHDYNKCHDRRMSVSKQKELNLLITAPQVPELSTGDDSLKNKVTVEEPSIQDNHVCEIKPQPQPQPQPEHRCSSKNNLGQSAAPQVQIKWGPQVSLIYLFSLSSSVDMTKSFRVSQHLPRQPILIEVFVVFPTTPRQFDCHYPFRLNLFFFKLINTI